MKKETENWISFVEKDLRMAKAGLDIQEPTGVIFHLHAAIEKLLKGICIETKGVPPKIHSLHKLAFQVCELELEKKQIALLELLDTAFIDSRYPGEGDEFEDRYNIDRCRELTEEVKEIIKCLKSILMQS